MHTVTVYCIFVIHSVIPKNCQMSLGVDPRGPAVIGWHTRAPPVEPYRLQKLVLALHLAAIWCSSTLHILSGKKESFN